MEIEKKGRLKRKNCSVKNIENILYLRDKKILEIYMNFFILLKFPTTLFMYQCNGFKKE